MKAFSYLSVLAIAGLLCISCSPASKEEPTYLTIEGVEFDQVQAEMAIGDTLTISAKILPYGTVVNGSMQWDEKVRNLVFWKSDNPKVATVSSNGLVTAVGKGSCTISLVCGVKAACCKVIVRSFPEDMLFGMWTTDDRDSIFLDMDGTGMKDNQKITWTYDGMRLAIFKEDGSFFFDDVMVLTSINDMKADFHYAKASTQSSGHLTKVAYPIDENWIQNGLVQISGKSGEMFHAVDLGLPSGTLWAICNIGADRPEDRGSMFSWAETESKNAFSLSNYIWYSDSIASLTGYTDCVLNASLSYEDDAAFVNWGENWQTPSPDNVGELVGNCRLLFCNLNGTYGIAFVPKASGFRNNRLFLPFTGFAEKVPYYTSENEGFYWTSRLSGSNPFEAEYFSIGSESLPNDAFLKVSHTNRYSGLFIRPVSTKRQ